MGTPEVDEGGDVLAAIVALDIVAEADKIALEKNVIAAVGAGAGAADKSVLGDATIEASVKLK